MTGGTVSVTLVLLNHFNSLVLPFCSFIATHAVIKFMKRTTECSLSWLFIQITYVIYTLQSNECLFLNPGLALLTKHTLLWNYLANHTVFATWVFHDKVHLLYCGHSLIKHALVCFKLFIKKNIAVLWEFLKKHTCCAVGIS